MRFTAGRGVALVALPWAAFVLLGYYRTHLPVTGDSLGAAWSGLRLVFGAWSLTAVGATLTDVTTVASFVLLITPLGYRLAGAFGGRLRRGERLAAGYLIGSWLVALASVILADNGLLSKESVLLGLLLMGIAGAAELRARILVGGPGKFADMADFVRGLRPVDRVEVLLWLGIAAFLLLGWSQAVVPPTGWDTLVYHLAGPKIYLTSGHLPSGAEGMHFGFPPMVETLMLDLLLLRSDAAAQLLHGTFLLVALVPTYHLAAARRGRRAGVLAALVLVATPTVLHLAGLAYADLALLASVTLAFAVLDGAVVTPDDHQGSAGTLEYTLPPGRVALAGLLAGIGASVKYTGLVFAISLVVALFARSVHLWPRGRLWSLLAGLTLAFAVSAGPWYVRNWIVQGNPIYPFLFGGPGWDAARAAWYSRAGTGLLQQPLQLALLPVMATFFGIDGGEGYGATIGPLWLLLLPIGIAMRPRRLMDPLALAGIVVFVWWAVGAALSDTLQQTRLVLPIFGILAASVGCTLVDLRAMLLDRLRVGQFLCVASAIVLVLTGLAALQGWLAEAPLASVVGTEGRESALQRLLPGHFEAFAALNAEMGSAGKAFFLWEPRTYYATACVVGDQILDHWRRGPFETGEALQVVPRLREAGYTHLLVYRKGLDFLLRTGHDAIDPAAVNRLIAAQEGGLVLVYGAPIQRDPETRGIAQPDVPYAIFRVTPPPDTSHESNVTSRKSRDSGLVTCDS